MRPPGEYILIKHDVVSAIMFDCQPSLSTEIIVYCLPYIGLSELALPPAKHLSQRLPSVFRRFLVPHKAKILQILHCEFVGVKSDHAGRTLACAVPTETADDKIVEFRSCLPRQNLLETKYVALE